MGLGDAALMKDTDVPAAGGAALRAVGAGAPDVPEAEVDSLEQLDEVLAEDVKLVLLNTVPVCKMQIAVRRCPARNSSRPADNVGRCGLQLVAAPVVKALER